MTAAFWMVFAFCIFPMTNTQITTTSQPAALAHISNSFYFLVNAPLAQAAPLFGPKGERSWAGEHWNPEFLYPQPGRDIQGAVFTVQHGPYKSVWVNTVFDLAAGKMQYVSFIPGHIVSTIDVRLTSTAPSTTRVEVTYTRTALDPSANDDVDALGRDDRESGPHWQEAIEASLKEHRPKTP
jgi:hypothetical protein